MKIKDMEEKDYYEDTLDAWEKGCNGIKKEDFILNPDRFDLINNPTHYTVGGYEAIDVMKAKLTPEEWRGACKANALKYLMRANYKNNHDSDCRKAEFYIQELCDALESNEVKGAVPWIDEEQIRKDNSNGTPL